MGVFESVCRDANGLEQQLKPDSKSNRIRTIATDTTEEAGEGKENALDAFQNGICVQIDNLELVKHKKSSSNVRLGHKKTSSTATAATAAALPTMQRIKILKATTRPLVSPVPRRPYEVERQIPISPPKAPTSNMRDDEDDEDEDQKDDEETIYGFPTWKNEYDDEVEQKNNSDESVTPETFFPFYFTYLQRILQCVIAPEIQRLVTLFCIYPDDVFLMRVGRINGVTGIGRMPLAHRISGMRFIRDIICHSEGTLVFEDVMQTMFIHGAYYGCYTDDSSHLHGIFERRPMPLSSIQLFFRERCGHAFNPTFVAQNKLVQCEHSEHIALSSQKVFGKGIPGWRFVRVRSENQRPKLLQSPLINVQQIEKIHCGANHALILMRDGSVFGVGANQYYQCVPHHQDFIESPARVELVDDDADDDAEVRIVDIVVGDNFNFLIDNRRRLWIYGFSRYYAMGVDVDWCRRPILHPNVHANANANVQVMKVDCAVGHALVTVDDGDCFAFGHGSHHIFRDLQMGILSCVYDTDKQPSRIVDIACGERHSLMLTQRNEVYAIGNNKYHQCSNRYNIGNQDHVIEAPLKLHYKEDLCILDDHLRIVQVFASKYESIFVVQ